MKSQLLAWPWAGYLAALNIYNGEISFGQPGKTGSACGNIDFALVGEAYVSGASAYLAPLKQRAGSPYSLFIFLLQYGIHKIYNLT